MRAGCGGDGDGNSSGDYARLQYMKRALSIVLQTTGFEGASAGALDILCAVGVHYMQNMFSQVHAYAEHATRTRPNMNDVGRALDERQVSVAQLDAYCTREIAAAQQPPAATAIDQLRRQASRVAGAPPADSASAVFFDARAEELLCKLVGLHTSSADRAQDTGDPDTGGVSGNGRHDSDEDSDFEAPDVDSADTPDAAAARQPEGAPAAEDPERAQPPPPATPPSAAKAMLLPSPSLPDYIPTHCPLFPSPHTYRQTPVFPKREQDFFRTRMHKAEQSRQAEENLQRLISGPHAEWAAPADDASSPSPRDPADGPGAHAKHHHAHKRIRHLFPPPNFRTVRKRTRLTDSI